MSQAGRGFMFSKGYRLKGKYMHAVVKFVKSKVGKEFADNTLFIFNKTRKKRHTAGYEQVNLKPKVYK